MRPFWSSNEMFSLKTLWICEQYDLSCTCTRCPMSFKFRTEWGFPQGVKPYLVIMPYRYDAALHNLITELQDKVSSVIWRWMVLCCSLPPIQVSGIFFMDFTLPLYRYNKLEILSLRPRAKEFMMKGNWNHVIHWTSGMLTADMYHDICIRTPYRRL